MAQARAGSLPGTGGAIKIVKHVAVALVGLALAAGNPASAAAWSDTATVDALRALPIQHDGRSMPLDKLARETVWNVTGKRFWRGEDPVRTVLGWTFDGERAANDPLVKVGSDELAAAIGLPPGQTHASFLQLVRNERLLDLFAPRAPGTPSSGGLTDGTESTPPRQDPAGSRAQAA